MEQFADFFNSPWGGAIGAVVLSAAVRALPVPAENAGPLYVWFYNFTHSVLANFDKVGKR